MSDNIKIGSVVLGLGFNEADVAAFEARLKKVSERSPTIKPKIDTADADVKAKKSADDYAKWWRDALRERSMLERQAAQAENAARRERTALERQAAQAETAARRERAALERQAAQAATAALRERAALERQTAQAATAAIDQVRLAQTRARNEYERGLSQAQGWRDRATATMRYKSALDDVSRSLERVTRDHQLNVNQMNRVAQMQGQLNRSMSGLGSGSGLGSLLGNLTNLVPALGGAAANSASTAQAFTSVLGVTGPLAAGLTAVAVGVTAVSVGLAKAAKEAADFEQGMQGITSIQDMTGAATAGMASNFQKLSTELPVTTVQLTGIARNAALLGVTGVENIENFTKSVAMLGVATRDNNKGFVDMSAMAENVAIFLNETGSTAETFAKDMDDVVATLAAVDQVTPGTIQGVLNLTRYMASGAVTLGLTREAILSMSGALTGLGANAEGGGSAVIRVLMAMNRAANGNRKELDALGERLGITKDELANMFEGQPTAKLEAFSRMMGVSADEAKRLIVQQPEQAFLRLAQGLHEAHERGENMTAIMDELGLKNVRDIRLIDQMIVGHNLLGRAIEAGTDKEKNRAQLQERVAKATANFNDEMAKARNATTAFLQNAGAPMMDWLTGLAKGWTEAMNALSGYLEKLNDKRLNKQAEFHVKELEDQIAFEKQSIKINQDVINDPSASRADKDNAKRIIAEINVELPKLEAELAAARGEVASYRARTAQQNVADAVAKGTLPLPNTGGIPGAGNGTITGAQLASLLGMGGRTRGTPYGQKYAWGEHVGEDRFAPVGTPVLAPFTGNAKLRWDAAQGNVVDMFDANGVRLSMIHLQGYAADFAAALKAAGGTLKVAQGQVIGYVGQTGTSAHAELGPKNAHLHYHAYRGNTRLNPNQVGWQSMSDNDAWARTGPGAGARPTPPVNEGGKPPADNTDWVAKAADLMQRYADAVKAGNTKLATELNNQIAVFKRTHMSAWNVAEDMAQKKAANLKQQLKDGGLSDADWKKLESRAMHVARLNAQAADSTDGSLKARANREAADFNKDPKQAAALKIAEDIVKAQQKVSVDASKAAQQRAEDQRRLDQAISAGKLSDAERALDGLKRTQAAELDAVKDNESKKAQVIKQSGAGIIAAGDRIANLRRDQAVKAAREDAEKAKTAEGADLEAIEKTRVAKVQEAYKVAAAERAKNRADQANAERDAADRAADYEKQKAREAAQAKANIARASRELDQQLARQTVQDLEEARQRALENAGDDVNKRIAAEKQFGALIRDAQKAEAQITYRNAMKEAANGEAQLRAQREKLAKQNLDGALAGADQTFSSRERAATKAVSEQVKSLRGEYAQLADTMREKIATGKVEDADLQDYLKSLSKLTEKVNEAGMAQNGMIQGAQASSAALYQAAIDAAISAGIYSDIADQTSRLNTANTKVQASFETVSAMVPELSGDFDEANEQLDKFVENMEDLDKQGILAAGVLDKLRDHVDDLRLAMQLDQGDLAAAQALQDLASDPVSGMDGGQAGEFYAKQSAAQKKLTDDLLASMMELDQGTLQNADSIKIWADMLENAGKTGGITTDQLAKLQSVLDLMKGTTNLLPDDFATFSEAVKAAGEDGKYTAQELKDLADMLDLLGQNASDNTDYSQYADIADGAPKPDPNKPQPVGPTPEQRAGEAARLRGLIDADELLQTQNEHLDDQIALWESIINGEVETGAISSKQAETLKKQLGLMKDMAEERRKAAQMAAADAALAPDIERMNDLYGQFAEGKITAAEFATGVDGISASLQALADAGNETAQKLIEGLKDGKQAARELEDVLAEGKSADLEFRNSEAVRRFNFRAQKQFIVQREQLAKESAERVFAREIEGLTEGEPRYKLAQAKLEAARTAAAREGVNARKALLQTELSQYGQWASQAAGLFRKLNGDQENALSILADGVSAGFEVAAKVASGDMVGAVFSGIEAVLNLGESIANLNPQIQAWKKGLQEIADLEKQSMGNKRIGGSYGMNSIENPFYDKLAKDSSNREKLANSKWYQRLIWGIFGGSPEVLKDDTAKALSTASAVFNDFATSAYSMLEDTLMNAVQSGDFSGINDAIGKQIDGFVQRLAIQTVIAKSNLKNLIAQLGEDVAAGRDTTSTIAAIRAEENRIANQVQGLAPSLPGYASGGPGGSSGSSLVGNAPTAQIGAPSFTLSLPPEVLQPLASFAAAVPTFARAAEKLERVADRLAPGGTPQLSNQGGLT